MNPAVLTRVIGASTLAASAAVALLVFTGWYRKPFEPSGHVYSVAFDRAPQLHKGDQVRIRGNVEGKVQSVSEGPGGQGALVRFQVHGDRPVYRDARARLSFKTLLGGAEYIDLDPGSPATGPLGGHVIPRSRTIVQAEIEDLTAITRGDAMHGFTRLPGAMATGLSDAPAVGQSFRTLNAVADGAATGLEAFRGQQPGKDLPQLVDATARAVRALDRPHDEMRTLVSGAAATLDVLGRRDAELRETIAAAPSVTSDMTTTFARLGRTLDIADGLVRRLTPAAPQVAPTLDRLRPTLANTSRLLREARPLTAALPPTLVALNAGARQLQPLLEGITPSLQRFDDTILPYLNRDDPGTGKPTSVMIGGFFSGFGGAAAQQDANGHFIRFPASIGASTTYIPCQSKLVNPDAGTQLACDSFNGALAQYLRYLPHMPTAGGKRG